MNNPSPIIDIIKEREKMFDELEGKGNFVYDALGEEIFDRVKSFHRATILAVLTELNREMFGMEKTDCDDGAYDHALMYGHNSAITLVRAKLSEAIKELGE